MKMILLASLSDFAKMLAQTDIMNQTVVYATGMAIVIAGIIAIILAGFKIGHVFFEDGFKKLIDKSAAEEKYREIVRVFYLLVLLGSYPLWMGVLTGGMNFINKITTVSDEYSNTMDELVNNMMSSSAETNTFRISKEFIQDVKENPDDHDETTKKLISNIEINATENETIDENIDESSNIKKDKKEIDTGTVSTGMSLLGALNPLASAKSIASSILGGLIIAIGALARLIMIDFIKGGWMIIITVGPLAIAWSVWYKDQISHYMKLYFNAAMAITTVNLIDLLGIGYVDSVYEGLISFSPSSNSGYFDGIKNNMFAVIIAAAYFSSYKITSYYVGKNAGGIAGKAVSMAAAVVGGAASAFVLTKIPGTKNAMNSLINTVSDSGKEKE